MIEDLAELKDLLVEFGRHLDTNMSDDEIESAVEDYIESNEDRFFGDSPIVEDD